MPRSLLHRLDYEYRPGKEKRRCISVGGLYIHRGDCLEWKRNKMESTAKCGFIVVTSLTFLLEEFMSYTFWKDGIK